MQTRKYCMGLVSGLVGDPSYDWLTPEYFSPLCQIAYDAALQYISGTCSPYIEKVVLVPGVNVGTDENDLVTSAIPDNKYPLDGLILPRYIDFKPAGSPACKFRPVQECTVLPDPSQEVTPGSYDIRVRGDFLPDKLTQDTSIIRIHPNAAHALAFSVGALIGAERPNDGWSEKYGALAQSSWDEIASALERQQQHLTFRIGSPNRQNRNGTGYNLNLQSNMGWEWRSFGLYLKLI